MSYTLLDAHRQPYQSETPGELAGNNSTNVYGRLNCPMAAMWIARGKYVKNRVFFANEAAAVAADYRPCYACMPDEHRAWKAKDRCGRPETMIVELPPEERHTYTFVFETAFGPFKKEVEMTHRIYDPPNANTDEAFFAWINALDDLNK